VLISFRIIYTIVSKSYITAINMGIKVVNCC